MSKYEIYDKPNITKELLNTIKTGDYIKVNTWKRPMKVIAVSENFFIMWKPHFGTWSYSICEKNKRGTSYNLSYRPKRGYMNDEFVCDPDNYVFGKYDYNDVGECQDALVELESGEMEVSTRHGLGIWHLEIKRGK